jgi:HAE1 family hydrophobic/amphiphilic exporter-1
MLGCFVFLPFLRKYPLSSPFRKGGKRGISGIRSIIFICLVFLFLFMPAVSGAGEEKPVKILNLEEALKIAGEKNKDILKAQEYQKQVEGRYVEERAAALPQFLISSGIYRSHDESQKAYGPGFPLERDVRVGSMGLSQVLFTFGQVGAAIRGARIGIASADEQLRIFRQATLRDVSAAFYDVLLAGELNALARQNLDQKIRHRDEVQKKFKLGVATDYDILAAEVAVENARPEVIRMENLVQSSREKLRFLLGMGNMEVEVQGSLEKLIAPYPTLEEAVKKARINRPDVADIRHRIRIAEELIIIAKAGDKPRLDLKADWGWTDLSIENSRADGLTWMAGVFLTYPIFDGMRSRGRVLQAKSNLATLKIEESKLMDVILLQTRDAVDAVREAGEIVSALTSTVSQADRLLLMAEKGYEFGVNRKLDVDDAALNRTQARGNLARARRDYLVALVTLDWVTGAIGEPGK